MIIYDQFDTEPVGAFSGSMKSDILQETVTIFNVGFFEKVRIGNSAIRKVDISALDSRAFLNSDLPKYVFGQTNSTWMSGKNFQRNTTFICPEEQFADSVIGYPLDYTKVNGFTNHVVTQGPIGQLDPNLSRFYGFVDTDAYRSVTLFLGTTGTQFVRTDNPNARFCDNIWNYTCPFQSKYKNVFKTKSRLLSSQLFNTSFTSWNYGPTITNEVVVRSYDVISNISFTNSPGITALGSIPNGTTFMADRVLFFPGSPAPVAIAPAKPGAVFPNLTTKLLYNCFFGFGDNPGNSPNHNDLFRINSFLSVSYVPTIRGYKYGLVSAMPKNTTMTFRNNHFGYPRDMLEQRPFTKFYDERGNIQGAVTVNFKSGTVAHALARDYLTATNPTYNPRDSGIYDYEYKSGFGFIDIEPVD